MQSKISSFFLAQFTLDQCNKCINQFLPFCTEVEFTDHSVTDERDAIIAQFLNDIAVKSDRPKSALKTFMAPLTHYYKTINAPINSELLTNFCKALTKAETNKKKKTQQAGQKLCRFKNVRTCLKDGVTTIT